MRRANPAQRRFRSKWRQRPRIVSFSLDRDTEIVIRALGGSFYRFEHGRPTGINPLQREPTEARMGHWSALVRQCLATPQLPLLPSELEAIDKAVRGVAAMDVRDRWFSTVKQQLPRNGENSLFNRMNRWCRGNKMGWVFDEANGPTAASPFAPPFNWRETVRRRTRWRTACAAAATLGRRWPRRLNPTCAAGKSF